MRLLTRKNLLAECTKTEVVLDEDALLAAIFEGKITDKDAAGIYDESENFAFFLVDDDDPDDAD